MELRRLRKKVMLLMVLDVVIISICTTSTILIFLTAGTAPLWVDVGILLWNAWLISSSIFSVNQLIDLRKELRSEKE